MQSIEFDLKEKQYDKALNKIQISKELVNKVSPVICTDNELFDFILNLEFKYFMQNNKQIKVCIFISQNRVYDRLALINNIIDILKILCSYVDKLEFFMLETESDFLQIRFIISNPNLSLKNNVKEKIKQIVNKNIQISNNEQLVIIEYMENLKEYI